MKFIILYAYLATAILSNRLLQQSCGENEEYNSCGSACPGVCGQTSPTICILVCVEGCFCKEGFIRNPSTGECISENQCKTCPPRCTGGFDGCNSCGCDRLGSPTFCTQRACFIDEIEEAKCGGCEDGYVLNEDTNTCDPVKKSCEKLKDCDKRNGFRCQTDPECREYSDLDCADTGRVCVAPKKNKQTACDSESDCNTEDGFGCLIGDIGTGVCVKYQSP